MEISCIDEREEKAEDTRQDLVASGWFVNPSTSEKKSQQVISSQIMSLEGM